MKLKSSNPNNNTTSETSWGMGSFFLVHFPPPPANKKPTRLINSGHHLLSKAQSTIYICLLLLILSLFFFTLSTFEPTAATAMHHRRQLTFLKLHKRPVTEKSISSVSVMAHALQGMGTTYMRGTKSMHGLIICHLTESVTVNDVSLFLRLFFRSSLYSNSDILFIFNSDSVLRFDAAIRLENELFFRLVTRFKQLNGSDGAHFVRSGKKERASEETIWGRRRRNGNVTELTRLSYGSVIGFEVDELDSENSLSGFLDHVPMSLRRWACYTMLLGRVRKSFKHVMLVDLKEVLLLGDPLGRVNNKSPDSVFLSTFPTLSKHGKKNSEKTQLSPSIIFGGARGIRRLSNAILIEIVRTTMQRKRKNSVSELGVLSQLVKNEFLLKNVKLMMFTELTLEASSLNSDDLVASSNYTVVRRGNSSIDIVYSIFMKHICSFPLDSLVYNDCYLE